MPETPADRVATIPINAPEQSARDHRARRRTIRLARDAAAIWLVAAVLAWSATQHFTLPRQAETTLEDLIASYFFRTQPVREDIAIFGLTEESLAQLPYRSPVSRDFLADLLTQLIAGEPAAIGFDIIFDQPTEAAADARLRSAIESSPVPVVIATGSRDSGLTAKQLAFQSDYLAGLTTGASALASSDGVVRHIYLGTSEQPGFAFELFRAVTGETTSTPETTLAHLDYPGLTDEGNLPFSTFPAHLASVLPGEWIKNRVVLIGGDLPLQDRHRTPYSIRGSELKTIPGVTIHALALAQLLDDHVVDVLSANLSILLLSVLTGLGLIIGLPILNLWTRIVGLALATAGCWALIAWLYLDRHILLTPLAPVLGLIVCTATASFYYGRNERRTRRFVENAFGHYVSPQIVNALSQVEQPPELGGEARTMSFVFTDLQRFTNMSENMAPADLVELLQEYLGGLVDIAFEHGATIDKFVGDAIHVFFGAPADQPDHAQRAMRCALAMDAFSEKFRADRAARGLELGMTRIGVHTGEAVVGNVGGSRLFSYTAHGDVVNTSARLEVANKRLGTRICMSEAIAEANPDVRVRPVGDLQLRGKSRLLRAYTPAFDVDEALAEAYIKGFTLLDEENERQTAGTSQARRFFSELAARYPQDELIALHRQRTASGETGTVIVLD